LKSAVSRLRRYFSFKTVAFKLGRFMLIGIIAGHAALFVLILGAGAFLSKWNPPVTSLVLYREITAHQKVSPGKFVPLNRIPRSVRDMSVRLEDMNFYVHGGIDFAAIKNAYMVNKAIGYTLYGGSTIPQQLARTLFLTPRKSYFRKYLEALISIELDLLLSKQRLLELYLNNIEWGKGVFGIGAASLQFYGKLPAELSVDQLRRLVAILPNPLRYTVWDFSGSLEMRGRYQYLVSRFPDPRDAEPATAEDRALGAAAAQAAPAAPEDGSAGKQL
jgi:monofunctional biosynthetic peptidoglycan transglycosylase